MTLLSTLTRCAALGAGTGIRTATPLALLSYAASKGEVRVPAFLPFSLLDRFPATLLLATSAVGEAAADATLPLPARTTPGPLVGRMAIGALIGVVLCADEGQPIALGAGMGAISAAWGSFAATGGRGLLVESGVPDIVASLLEDVEALLLGASVLRRVGSAVG